MVLQRGGGVASDYCCSQESPTRYHALPCLTCSVSDQICGSVLLGVLWTSPLKVETSLDLPYGCNEMASRAFSGQMLLPQDGTQKSVLGEAQCRQ